MNTLPTFRAELQKARAKYDQEHQEQMEALYAKHKKRMKEFLLRYAGRGWDAVSFVRILHEDEFPQLHNDEIKFILDKLGVEWKHAGSYYAVLT